MDFNAHESDEGVLKVATTNNVCVHSLRVRVTKFSYPSWPLSTAESAEQLQVTSCVVAMQTRISIGWFTSSAGFPGL